MADASNDNIKFSDYIKPVLGAGLGWASSRSSGLNTDEIGNLGRSGGNTLNDIASGRVGPGLDLNILGSYQNPYLDASIAAGQRHLTDQFQNQILPQIGDTFSKAGSFGSGRQAALTGTATQNLTRQLADIEAQQRNAAYQAAYDTAGRFGLNKYKGQFDAANKLYDPATKIAGASPWKAGLGGLGAFGGLNSPLGKLGSSLIDKYGNKAWDWLGDKAGKAWDWAGDKISGGYNSIGSKGADVDYTNPDVYNSNYGLPTAPDSNADYSNSGDSDFSTGGDDDSVNANFGNWGP